MTLTILLLFCYATSDPVFLHSSKLSSVADLRAGRVSVDQLVERGVAFTNVTEVSADSFYRLPLYMYVRVYVYNILVAFNLLLLFV